MDAVFGGAGGRGDEPGLRGGRGYGEDVGLDAGVVLAEGEEEEHCCLVL